MSEDADYDRLKDLYRRCAFYDVFAQEMPRPSDYQPPASVEQTLRDFCLASGRDLEELNGFLHGVGCEIADAVPK
jgi:hypothetical protein